MYCRECAVKFNDYFEFPREVDMSPYTAATLAKLEGKLLIAKMLNDLNFFCYC